MYLECIQILKDQKLNKMLDELNDCGVETAISVTKDKEPSLIFVKRNCKVPIKVEWDKILGIWCMKFFAFDDVSDVLDKFAALLFYMDEHYSFKEATL